MAAGTSNVVETLRRRGLVVDATPGVEELFAGGAVTAYIGFDPTADSFHVGSLLPILALVHLQRAGHRPVALMGSGTGMIGDPSGKATERPLLSRDQIAANAAGMREQLGRFLDFGGERGAVMLDNAEWLAPAPLLEFLRDVGKHFSVNVMLQKESVRRRLDSEDGISFAEFTYQLLQAWDFLMLYDRLGCRLQLGGSDQWGNITAGADLIRRTRSAKAHGLVMPLITSASGAKFGKTEAGTVWLDAARTSPFRFYQYWVNTDDRDAVKFLRYFTLLGDEAIAAAEAALAADPAGREAQKLLAREVTTLVHGAGALARAERATQVFFGAEFGDLAAADLLDVFADVPATPLARGALAGGKPLVDLLAETGMAKSKGEARRLVEGGGVYVNNRRAEGVDATVRADDCIEGRVLVLRKGKKEFHVVRIS